MDPIAEGGLKRDHRFRHDLPLRGRRQQDAQVLFQASSRFQGNPFPYRSMAIMAAADSSYSFSTAPSGAAAVKTLPQR
jgi:hypothetical protein